MTFKSVAKPGRSSRQAKSQMRLPVFAYRLAGPDRPKTEEALNALFEGFTENRSLPFAEGKEKELEAKFNSSDFELVVNGLVQKKWDDEQTAELLRYLKSNDIPSKSLDLAAFAKFIGAHPDKSTAQAVIDCVKVHPPTEIEIIRLLSGNGNQKTVYLGTWRSTNQTVVVKRIRKIKQELTTALHREAQNHPLSLKSVHMNIIQTHMVKNDVGEIFLVERYLNKILSEDWRAAGVQEASALLFDLLSALAFIHSQGLVHGDIKPDNIGVAENGFILMDFGSCHKTHEFKVDNGTVGSIRTQAPELLLGGKLVPSKIDIWSLGATIFYGMCGRFPLFGVNEEIPPANNATLRQGLKRELVRRIENEWGKFTSTDGIPPPLCEIIRRMLEKDPEARPSASDLISYADKELLSYRVGRGMVPVVAAITLADELITLENWMQRIPVDRFSQNRRQRVLHRLTDLMPDVKDERERLQIEKLIAMLSSQ